MVKVRLVGDLYITELLLFLYALLNLVNKRIYIDSFLKITLVFLVIWFVGQIISDIFNEAAFNDRLRGEIRVVFFAFDILGIYFLTRKSINNLFVFLIGLACGNVFSYLFFPSEFAQDYPWKFGLAVPFGMIVVYLSSIYFKYNKNLSYMLMIVFGVASILLGGRSLGGVFIISGIIVWYLNNIYKQNNAGKKGNVLVFFSLMIMSLGGISQGYSYAAKNGLLGEVSQWKYIQQSSSQYGVLLSGRVEIFASSQAIMDSPIFGHGSWAKDWKYIDLIQKIRESDTEYNSGYVPEDNLIPSHSHILGAWVESGVLGAIFWFYILWSVYRCFINIKSNRTAYLPLVIWAMVALLWDLFFSPFGAHQRVLSAFYIIVVLYAQNNGFKIKEKK
jgi:hypothetical protein